MQIEYGGSKVDLHRCPFCGSAPLIHSYRSRMRLWYRIRCSNENEDCRMMPETTAHQKLVEAAADWNQRGTRDAALVEIWQQLTDVPMDPETECLEVPFYDWPAGTHREEIWHWFDERHSKGVAYLLCGGGSQNSTGARVAE